MKQVYNTNGLNTTSACFDYLLTADSVIIKDGYFIGPPIRYPQANLAGADANYGAYPVIDSDQPITYQGQAPQPITFMPFSIEREKLSYKTGFESSTLNLTLRPRDTLQVVGADLGGFRRGVENNGAYSEGLQVPAPYADLYAYAPDNNILQSMRQSFTQTDWYLAPVTMFRFFMPTWGDVTTYGAAVMFRGRVSEFTVDKDNVKLTASSLMEIFGQKVPTQTIQPGNRWAPFDFNTTPDYAVSNNPVPAGGYNWVTLTFGDTPPANDALSEGWALIVVEGIGSWWRRIYTNKLTSGSQSTILFLEPLPVNLGEVNVTIEIDLWESQDTSTNPSGPGAGFPYIPQPFTGIA